MSCLILTQTCRVLFCLVVSCQSARTCAYIVLVHGPCHGTTGGAYTGLHQRTGQRASGVARKHNLFFNVNVRRKIRLPISCIVPVTTPKCGYEKVFFGCKRQQGKKKKKKTLVASFLDRLWLDFSSDCSELRTFQLSPVSAWH